MLKYHQSLIVSITLSLAALGSGAQEFWEYHKFPEPAPFSFGIVGKSLPDGRLVLWNGDGVYLQYGVGTDAFDLIATGYSGDPAFLVVRDDGHTLLLGQGYLGSVYQVDIFAREDYTPSSIVTTLSHFSGTLLTSDHLLMDVGTESFSSELQIVDLSGAKSNSVSVVTKSEKYARSKEVVSDKPPSSYSSNVYLDEANGMVYAMDANARELRSFPAAALLNAFNTATPLDWETDGTLVGAVGDFYSGGVSGITEDDLLVIAGSEGFLQPGGIQLVDPSLGDPSLAAVVETLDPAGTHPFYSAIYNEATDSITARTDTGEVFAPDAELQAVPLLGVRGLFVLAFSLLGVGLFENTRLRRKESLR